MHFGFPWWQYLSVQILGSIYKFSILTWWVRNILSAILILCNRLENSKITSYFELFWTKYFHFDWQNVSTYFCTLVRTRPNWQIIHKSTEYILTLQKHVPKELNLQVVKNSEYWTQPCQIKVTKLKPVVLHFRRELYKNSLQHTYGQIIPWQRSACLAPRGI